MSDSSVATGVGKTIIGVGRTLFGSAISLIVNAEIIYYFYHHLLKPVFHIDYGLLFSQAAVLSLIAGFVSTITQIDVLVYIDRRSPDKSDPDWNKAFLANLIMNVIKFVAYMLTIYILGWFVL